MKDKEILFVCQFFYPEDISSGILPFELASELVKSGYRVKALVGFPKEYTYRKNIKSREIVNGINIKRIRYLTLKKNRLLNRLLNYCSFCISVIIHFNFFKNVDYCISYTNPPFLPPIIALLSRLYKFKYIFEIYDLYPDTAIRADTIPKDSLTAKIFNYLTNFALKKSWKIIVLSNECKNYLIRTKSVNEKKIKVIPNWYKKQPVIEKNYPKQKLKILYGGNMGIMQDMDTIYNMLISMKNDNRFEFIFAGHGVKKEVLKKLIINYQLKNCIIYDFLPKKEYDSLMNEIDLALLSLEKFAVGLGSPSKLYGYLAKGIPVIAIISSETDIAKDIREYHSGIQIENGNSNILRKSLINLYNNQDLIKEMDDQSKKLFDDKYDINCVKEKYLSLLNDLG